MFVHIWKMRARKKRTEEYEQFGREVTLPSLKKITGCLDAHFLKVAGVRKPEYLWVVYWQDQKDLEAARVHPAWREQIKRFEAGNFYKTIPLELTCEALASSPKTRGRPREPKQPKQLKPSGQRPGKNRPPQGPQRTERIEKTESRGGAHREAQTHPGFVASTPEGE